MLLKQEEKGHRMRDRWIRWRKPRGSITRSGTHINHIPPMQVFSSRSLKHTCTHAKLFLVNYSGDSGPTSPDHHTEADCLIHQKHNDLLSFWPVRHTDTTNTQKDEQTHERKHPHDAASSSASLTGKRGRLDEGEKRHACDREVTMKSRQNEKSNWKTTGRVENSFSKLQRWSLVQIMAFSLQIRASEEKYGKWHNVNPL